MKDNDAQTQAQTQTQTERVDLTPYRAVFTETYTVDMFNQKVWTFTFDGHNLILDAYVEYYRETPRSKWKPTTTGMRYYRLSHRDSNTTADMVPLPFSVVQDVKKRFLDLCARVQVTRGEK